MFAHIEAGTVFVLNPARRRVALAARGEAKVYGYDEVREWSAQKKSRGGAVGIGVAGTIAARSASISASKQADLNTGLFLKVRDKDHPLWRISMFEASDRARWTEMLRQELSEGGSGRMNWIAMPLTKKFDSWKALPTGNEVGGFHLHSHKGTW